MLKEFKEFAFKGNLVDMAVGFILGGGFATVVKSLVDNVVMPPIGAMLKGVNFAELSYAIGATAEVKDADGVITAAASPGVIIKYGQFIQDFISFTLLAFVVFIVVKKVIEGMKKAEAPAAPAEPPAEEKLLTEIRDLLKSKA